MQKTYFQKHLKFLDNEYFTLNRSPNILYVYM